MNATVRHRAIATGAAAGAGAAAVVADGSVGHVTRRLRLLMFRI